MKVKNKSRIRRDPASAGQNSPESFRGVWEQVFLKSWHPLFWIILLGFLVYLQTLFFNFSHFDDDMLIIDRHYFLSNISNIVEAFKQNVFHLPADYYYRPLLTISFILDAQLGGISPFMYHFTNIIIHLIASCLLFILIAKLGYKRSIALFFTMVFMVHPVLTQAVCWIPGRNDSLLAIFILLTFIFFLKWTETKKWKYYALHMFFFAFALLTKELAFIMIVMIILYLHLILREKLFSFNKLMLGIGWLVIVACWLLARKSALSYPAPFNTSDIINAMIIDLPAIFIFVGKILFPFNLSVLPILKDSTFIFGYITVSLVLIALVLTKNKRYNFIIFGVLWFLFFLIPSFITSNISQGSFFVEHRVYLPLIGFIILCLETGLVKKMETKKLASHIIAATILIILTLITIIHSLDFKDRYAFWASAVKTSPHSPLAHNNIGLMYYENGKLDKAEEEYKITLNLNPTFWQAYVNLANVDYMKGEHDKAFADYNEAIRLNPTFWQAYFNRGLAYYAKGEFDKAFANYNEAIRLNPKYVDAYNNRGIAYFNKGELDKAIADYNEVIRLNPKYDLVYFNRGNVYYAKGEYDKAFADYNEAIRLNPKYVDAYNNRGIAYFNKGELDKAIADYNEVIKLNPKYDKAYPNRASAYFQKGEFDKAIADYNEVIKLNPKYLDAYINRGIAYFHKDEFDRAIADYNEVIKLNPKYDKAYPNRANAYYRKGELDKAITDWEYSLELAPNDTNTPKYRENIKQLKKQLQEQNKPR